MFRAGVSARLFSTREAHCPGRFTRIQPGFDRFSTGQVRAYPSRPFTIGQLEAIAEKTRTVTMEEPLVETWSIHNRINLYLLDAIADESLALALPKCRTVFDQFAHIHNVRLMWLKSAAPELLERPGEAGNEERRHQGPAPLSARGFRDRPSNTCSARPSPRGER